MLGTLGSIDPPDATAAVLSAGAVCVPTPSLTDSWCILRGPTALQVITVMADASTAMTDTAVSLCCFERMDRRWIMLRAGCGPGC